MNYDELLNVIKSYKESARKIADLYLEKFPRKLCCEVTVGPSELISTFLLEVSDDEIAILTECMQSVGAEGMLHRDGNTLEAVLKQKGYTDLLNRLCKFFASNETREMIDAMNKFFSRQLTPYIDSVNLHNFRKYATFGYFEYRGDNAPSKEQFVELPLTDEEFREILAKCLYSANRYTMNELIADMPMLSQRLMRMSMAETCAFIKNDVHPFILDMTEIKSVAARILNPFEDLLGLFGSEDEEMKEFLKENQLIGDSPRAYDFEAVDEEDGSMIFKFASSLDSRN